MVANRLLILDDDPRVLKLLVAAGERSRYEVTPTDSISQFRQVLESSDPSLIVVDLQSQLGLGSDLLQFLQRSGCTVPIIVVGGSDSHALDAVRQARAMTALTIIGTLVKPFPPEALTALLEIRREPDLDEWADEIRAAIEAGQIGVHYLPVVEVAGGRVVGFEALARWFHPRRGLISPGRFIPLAEATGLMEPLTDYVLARSIENCVQWSAAGFDLTVAVNVAAPSLMSGQILAETSRLLQEYQLPANRLMIEVSESAAMRQPELTSEILTSLHASGVGLSLDDFGTGYTNLKVLSQIPFNELKIDRVFVTDVLDNHQSQVIVKAIAALGRSLGLMTVAEGVENVETCRWLQELGIDRCQGFVFARPMPSDRVLDWLRGYTPPA